MCLMPCEADRGPSVWFQYGGLAIAATTAAAATAARFIPRNFYSVVSVVLSTGVQQPRHEAYRTSPPSTDVWNVWNCTFAVPDCLHGAYKDNFTFNSLTALKSAAVCVLFGTVWCWTADCVCASVCLASSVHVLCSCASTLQPCVLLNLIRSALHHCVRVIKEFSAPLRIERKPSWFVIVDYLYVLSLVARSECEIPYFFNYSGVYFCVLLCYLMWWEEATAGCWKSGKELQNLWCWSDKMKE
jgi:hypothetical protein